MECASKMLYLMLIISFIRIYNISDGADIYKNNKGIEPLVSIAGGRAEIPCASNPRKRGDQPVLILWYKNAFSKPVYSYDARSSKFSEGDRWANESLFGNRAYFVPLSKPHASLVVEPVMPFDEGEYTCRLDYHDSPTASSSTHLTVVVYPSPPEIYWENKLAIGPVGPVREGTYSQLVCISRGGRPPPTITWWVEGRQVIADIQRNGEENETRAILTLIASRDVNMRSFSCHAQVLHDGKPVGEPLVASVIFNIILAPIAITISGGDHPVAVDTTVILRCTAWGSFPPAEVIWWKSGKKFNPFVQSINDRGNSSSSEIKLIAKELDHGTTFSCQASNPKYNVPPLEKSVTLNVTYKPVVKLRVKVAREYISATANYSENSRTVVLKQGADIRMECPVHANPAPRYIEWLHNGITIESGRNAYSLLLENVRRENSGSYTCSASNEGGDGTSLPFTVTVEHAPECAKGWHKRTQGSEIKRSATILCRVEALPADDLTFLWSMINSQNKEVQFDSKRIQVDGTASRLTFTPETKEDFGLLLCKAKNSAGLQQEPCQVTLVPASRPDPPFNCSTEAGNVPGSLLVSCVEAFDGGFPQKFSLVAVQRGSIVANISREFSEWIIKNLETGKGVTIRIEAFNIRGRSDAVRLEVFVPFPQVMADQDVGRMGDNVSYNVRAAIPFIGILVGTGGVLIIGIFVLFVYCILTRQQRSPKPPTELINLPSSSSSSSKKSRSVTFRCSPQSIGYEAIIPLHGLKVSDPDIVNCVKDDPRRSSVIDVVQYGPNAQSLVTSCRVPSGSEIFDNSSLSSTSSGYHHCRTSDNEEVTDLTATGRETKFVKAVSFVDNERVGRIPENNNLGTNRFHDGDYRSNSYGQIYSAIMVAKSSDATDFVSIYDDKMDRRKSFHMLSSTEDIYAPSSSGGFHSKIDLECDLCRRYTESQSDLINQNNETICNSIEPHSIVETQIISKHKPHSGVGHDLTEGSCNAEAAKSMNNFSDGMYEHTSDLQSKNHEDIEPSSSQKKSKPWRSSFSGLLCSGRSQSDSLERGQKLTCNDTILNPNETYQKFDGVCPNELPVNSFPAKLENSPSESDLIKEPQSVTENLFKESEGKSEFDDLLYISKAELDSLLNLDGNKRERGILTNVTPLKELLQQGEISDGRDVTNISKKPSQTKGSDLTTTQQRRDLNIKKFKREENHKYESQRTTEALDPVITLTAVSSFTGTKKSEVKQLPTQKAEQSEAENINLESSTPQTLTQESPKAKRSKRLKPDCKTHNLKSVRPRSENSEEGTSELDNYKSASPLQSEISLQAQSTGTSTTEKIVLESPGYVRCDENKNKKRMQDKTMHKKSKSKSHKEAENSVPKRKSKRVPVIAADQTAEPPSEKINQPLKSILRLNSHNN